jgi:hypothetical protein
MLPAARIVEVVAFERLRPLSQYLNKFALLDMQIYKPLAN